MEPLFNCALAPLLCNDTKSSSYTAASTGPLAEGGERAEGEILSLPAGREGDTTDRGDILRILLFRIRIPLFIPERDIYILLQQKRDKDSFMLTKKHAYKTVLKI